MIVNYEPIIGLIQDSKIYDDDDDDMMMIYYDDPMIGIYKDSCRIHI